MRHQQRFTGKKYIGQKGFPKRLTSVTDHWSVAWRWSQSLGEIEHTATRIYNRLVDEYDFKGSASNIRNCR